MRIVKTPEERNTIIKFTKMMGDLFYSFAFENPSTDMKKIFNDLEKKIYDKSGTLYLCFSCCNIFDRKNIETQTYFQIKRVWHPCQNGNNNMSYPTAGIITRWKKVLKYIEKNNILSKTV